MTAELIKGHCQTPLLRVSDSVSVFISYSCCNKSPQTGQLQSTVSLSHSSVGQMFTYRTALVGPLLRVSRGWNQRCWQGCLPSWSLWGRICFCPHSACWPNSSLWLEDWCPLVPVSHQRSSLTRRGFLHSSHAFRVAAPSKARISESLSFSSAASVWLQLEKVLWF